jgi:hypothetical protein
MRLSRGCRRRPPRVPPSREERLRGGLLSLGGCGIGVELVGALRGGSGGLDLGTAGLVLTLVSAGTFAANLIVVLALALWHRWHH